MSPSKGKPRKKRQPNGKTNGGGSLYIRFPPEAEITGGTVLIGKKGHFLVFTTKGQRGKNATGFCLGKGKCRRQKINQPDAKGEKSASMEKKNVCRNVLPDVEARAREKVLR